MFWHSFLCKGQCFPGVQGAPPLLLSWNSTRHTSIQKGIFQNSTASLIQDVSVALNALKRSFPLTLSMSFIDFFSFSPWAFLSLSESSERMFSRLSFLLYPRVLSRRDPLKGITFLPRNDISSREDFDPLLLIALHLSEMRSGFVGLDQLFSRDRRTLGCDEISFGNLPTDGKKK